MLKQLNIGPGTVVLNQNYEHPMSGFVILCPENETDMEDHVWVQWCDRSVDDGVSQEYIDDLTLTGRIYVYE